MTHTKKEKTKHIGTFTKFCSYYSKVNLQTVKWNDHKTVKTVMYSICSSPVLQIILFPDTKNERLL